MKRTAILAAVLVGMCGVSFGAVIVSDGTGGGDWLDWTTATSPLGGGGSGSSSLVGGVGVGGHSGDTGISVPDPGPSVVIDEIYGSGNLGGSAMNWATAGTTGSGVKYITFDFYVPSGAPMPATLSVYFSDGSALWYNTISLGSYTGWEDNNYTPAYAGASSYGFGVGLGPTYPGSSWQNQLGAESQSAWNIAYQNVSQVGLQIRWAADVPPALNTYALDRFTLHDGPHVVPEPETYMAIGVALLGVCIAMRRQLNEKLASGLSMLTTI